MTNRALVLAALAGRGNPNASPTVLRGALKSEDTEIMVDCLQRLGIEVRCEWPEQRITVPATKGNGWAGEAELFVGNSGTTMRFLTAMLSTGKGTYRLDGIPRMRERPIHDLLTALQQLSVDAVSENNNGCPPIVVDANGLQGGTVRVKGDVSSQYLSGLLLAAPLAQDDVTIQVEGVLVSQPYVTMTLELMRHFGVQANASANQTYHIGGNQHYQTRAYDIEPDASAASYFAAAAAILGGEITIQGLNRQSLQGDMRFFDVLGKMGCAVDYIDDGVTVRGGPLCGIDVDMNDISDTVMTLAVVACFADGPTTIRNVGHIRHKETDRLAALATELQRIGTGVKDSADDITVFPQPLNGAEIETYNDHRMAMSFALVGLRTPGIVIKDPSCVAKTYPDFFADLDKLR